MRDTREPASRPAARADAPMLWVLVALLAAGVLLAVLQQDAGPWLVALAGALATLVAVVGLVISRGPETGTGSLAQQSQGGWTAVRTELARSRRHDRRFAIVGIPGEVWAPASAQSAVNGQLGLEIAQAVQALIRRPDRTWVDDSMVHVLLTDCDRRQGLAFLERARASMPQLFENDRVNLVVFPDDGITLGALVASLREKDEDPARHTVPE